MIKIECDPNYVDLSWNKVKAKKSKKQEEVLPLETLAFGETVKEKVFCRLSVTDSKFAIPPTAFDDFRIPADVNDGVGAGDGKIDCDAEDCPVRNVVEKYLLERVKKSTKRRKNKKKNESDDDEDNEGSKRRLISRIFQLAQFYFEERKYKKAFEYYDKIRDEDDQALFQIGVMTYDGLGRKSDPSEGVAIMRSVARADEEEEEEDMDNNLNKKKKKNKDEKDKKPEKDKNKEKEKKGNDKDKTETMKDKDKDNDKDKKKGKKKVQIEKGEEEEEDENEEKGKKDKDKGKKTKDKKEKKKDKKSKTEVEEKQEKEHEDEKETNGKQKKEKERKDKKKKEGKDKKERKDKKDEKEEKNNEKKDKDKKEKKTKDNKRGHETEDDEEKKEKDKKEKKVKEKKEKTEKGKKKETIEMTSSAIPSQKKASRVTSTHLLPAARYNIGTAYYQGIGVERQSYEEAERWWLKAAANGDPKGSVKAQTMLGIFYARKDSFDLERSFFWHSEACGNGSLESQGAIGVMYFLGIGVEKNIQSALLCLKEASSRGNIYAKGNLVAFYYDQKMFCLACDLGYKVSQLEFPNILARRTNCLPSYVRKGIALACFYYARCLDLSRGVKKDARLARELFSRSCRFCSDVAAVLQAKVVAEEI